MISVIYLTNNPNQTFTVTLQGESRSISLVITLSYNAFAGYWVMGILDATHTPLVIGIPMLCGYDLLRQLQHLNIGSAALFNVGAPTVEYPDSTNLDKFVLTWRLI